MQDVLTTTTILLLLLLLLLPLLYYYYTTILLQAMQDVLRVTATALQDQPLAAGLWRGCVAVHRLTLPRLPPLPLPHAPAPTPNPKPKPKPKPDNPSPCPTPSPTPNPNPNPNSWAGARPVGEAYGEAKGAGAIVSIAIVRRG